jgi:hypothetical protein
MATKSDKEEKEFVNGRNIELKDCPVIYDALVQETEAMIKNAVSVVDGKLVIDKTIIEIAPTSTTHKGYDTTGFRYQRLVNILNKVIGSSHWRSEVKVIERIMPDSGYLSLAMEVTIQIGNWIVGAPSYFDVVDSKTCYGTGKSKDPGDAYKGAFTNGFKKTVALFGLGSQAYTGELHRMLQIDIPDSDDEYEPEDTPLKVIEKKPSAEKKPVEVKDSDLPPVEYFCEVTGEAITAKQVKYCTDRGLKPVSYKVILNYRKNGREHELQAK